MKVYIVLKNGKVDEVFDNIVSAINHQNNLTNHWNLTKIIVMEVKSL